MNHAKNTSFDSYAAATNAITNYTALKNTAAFNLGDAMDKKSTITTDMEDLTNFETARTGVSTNLSVASDEIEPTSNAFTEDGAFYNGKVSYSEQLTLMGADLQNLITLTDTDIPKLVETISQKYATNLGVMDGVIQWWTDERDALGDAIDTIQKDIDDGVYKDK